MNRADQTPVAGDSFAYSTIEEYEEIIGHKVNEAFRIGWHMARTMNSHIDALTEPDGEGK